MNQMYWIILPVVILLGGLVIGLAARQDKKTKGRFRQIFLVLVLGTLLSGFFNWETFVGAGRSGFILASDYPQSLLFVFFLVAFVQVVLLLLHRYWTDVAVAILSFANTVVLFVGLWRLENVFYLEPFSYASIAALFAVLIGNVVGLMLVNKDKNLLAKFPWSAQSVAAAKRTKAKPVSGWIVWSVFAATVGFMAWLFILGTSGVDERRAIAEVRELQEVQRFLQDVPAGKVDIGSSDNESYFVQVYEMKNGHTATFNWYRVDKKNFKIMPEF